MDIKKKAAWRRTMTKGSSLTFGPDFWSNGHFLVIGDIPDKALRDKTGDFDLYERKSNATIEGMIKDDKKDKADLSKMQKVDKAGLDLVRDVCVLKIDGHFFDEDYVRVFFDLFGDIDIFVGAKYAPAVVKVADKIVGLLMPMKF